MIILKIIFLCAILLAIGVVLYGLYQDGKGKNER